jgi:hypothetical protein
LSFYKSGLSKEDVANRGSVRWKDAANGFCDFLPIKNQKKMRGQTSQLGVEWAGSGHPLIVQRRRGTSRWQVRRWVPGSAPGIFALSPWHNRSATAAVDTPSVQSTAAPKIAFFYDHDLPVDELRAFDVDMIDSAKAVRCRAQVGGRAMPRPAKGRALRAEVAGEAAQQLAYHSIEVDCE